MENPTNPLDAIMNLTLKAIGEVQDNLTLGLSAMNTQMTDEIGKLVLKCAALEAIQLRLFSALAETNPLVHSRIVEELAIVLEMLDKQEAPPNTAFVDHLRALTGIKAESRPLLRLVPPRVSPPTAE
jgi:hypothetical protein